MAVRKIELMYRQFGKRDGHTCGMCGHLLSGRYHDKVYRKCEVYGMTRGEASDWAKRWTACGMFNRAYTGRPIIELVRPERKPVDIDLNEPLEGQLQMEGNV